MITILSSLHERILFATVLKLKQTNDPDVRKTISNIAPNTLLKPVKPVKPVDL